MPPSASPRRRTAPHRWCTWPSLDEEYLHGSIVVVHSVPGERFLPLSTVGPGPGVDGEVRIFRASASRHTTFDPDRAQMLISTSVQQAPEQSLNYARNYLGDILERCVNRVIYLDSDLVVLDDIGKQCRARLGSRAVGACEYCYANFIKYFTDRFWSDHRLGAAFAGRGRATSTRG
ncbi:hypothetical protein C4D60_Mb08t09770 [Musa balbisiana]|uniref:Hexosyltransferase n=1 Tax=Musa balbisiana TaxID=52838 RepID=A0A4S8K2P4_MUSBA|nr:hypothetical protein C4D60_Mb08t09770 [Musa balbisiana]